MFGIDLQLATWCTMPMKEKKYTSVQKTAICNMDFACLMFNNNKKLVS